MSVSLVQRQDHGPVVLLTLNRPEKRNALSRALVADLSDTLDQAAVEQKVRAVVLTGAGTVFCAGMDMKEAVPQGLAEESERTAVQDAQGLAHLIDQVHRFPRPTIAAVNGDALAGGAGLALACDFVIASAEARIGYPEVLRGLVAAIVMHDLVRQAGERRARQLLLTGELYPAATAERWGLVNEVVAGPKVLERALELGAQLVKAAPGALAMTKKLIDEANNRPPNLRGAAAMSAVSRVGEEALEGMRAFFEKRPPAWQQEP